MNGGYRLRTGSVIAGLYLCLQIPFATALETSATLEYTTEYTTNTLQTESDEIGDWINSPGIAATASQDTDTLELDADYSYARRIYQKDIWQDEDRLLGGADLRWEPISQRLDFLLHHNRRLSTIQALETDTQANRQIVNTTEAGTTLRLQPRAGDEMQLEYTFTDIRTDETQTDSQRHNGTGRYIVNLSPNRSLTVLGSYSDIDYDTVLFSAAKYYIVSAGYAQTSNTLDLNITLGHNWYERSGRGKTGDPTYDATLVWRPSTSTTLTATGSHMITDQSQNLTERGSDSVSENTDVNAAFKETLGELMLEQAVGRSNTVTVAGYYRREKYTDDVALSNRQLGARANFRRNMTPTTTLDLFADFSNRDYTDQGDDQDELRAGITIGHRFGRSIRVNAGVRYEERDALTSTSYKETVGSIEFLWTFWGALDQ